MIWALWEGLYIAGPLFAITLVVVLTGSVMWHLGKLIIDTLRDRRARSKR